MTVGETHPAEEQLLAFVEGELPRGERDELERHRAGCDACTRSIGELEIARSTLRAAPLLELPRERWAAMTAELPERPRTRRPLLAVLLAAAAVALLAGALLAARDGGEGTAERTSLPAQAEMAREPPPEITAQNRLRTVNLPPGPAVALLQSAGVNADEVGGAVAVPARQRALARRALADVPPGQTVVFIR